MDVILLNKVANLGDIGDRVDVKSGYGRNFLLPQGKATLATPSNVAKFEARRAEHDRKASRNGGECVGFTHRGRRDVEQHVGLRRSQGLCDRGEAILAGQ